MKKLLLPALLFLVPGTRAQTPATAASLRLICNGPVFETAETMPALVHGSDAYADSLYTFLRSQQLPLNPGKLTLRIAILANGDVQFVKVLDSTITDPGTLIQAVLSLNNQWKPATQNKRAVCCYRKLYLEVADDRITVKVPERF